MNQNYLLNAILYLVPGAKCSVWKLGPLDKWTGEGDPILMGDYLVSWNSTNDKPCPTWDEIQKVDMNAVNVNTEKLRKTARNESMSNDTHLVSSFKIMKMMDQPNLSWSDFLDKLEAEHKNIKNELL